MLSGRKLAFPIAIVLAVSAIPDIAAAQNNSPSATSVLSAQEAFTKGAEAYERRDFRHALTWFRQAADQGNARAQGVLGAMYRDGQGAKQDYQQAAIWCRKAADQGLPMAQSDLGLMYANGWGVPQDTNKAIEWEQKAVALGYTDAQPILQHLQVFARGPSDDEIVQLVKDRINDEALEIITAEYAGVDKLSTNPLGAFQPKSKIATLISLTCSLNAPNERSACIEKMKAEKLTERDEEIRKAKGSDISAKFVYSVRDKTRYEGNYVVSVNLRKTGTDRTFQEKLLLQFAKDAWVIAEKTEQEIK